MSCCWQALGWSCPSATALTGPGQGVLWAVPGTGSHQSPMTWHQSCQLRQLPAQLGWAGPPARAQGVISMDRTVFSGVGTGQVLYTAPALLGCIRKSIAHKGGEAAPGVLCPLWGSSGQEGHGTPGAGPAEATETMKGLKHL